MTSNYKLLIVIAILLGSFGLLAFYGINAGAMGQPATVTANSNAYKFPINTLATLQGGNNPSYRIVVYHDDGTFFMGSESELAVHQHTYSSNNNSPTYNPFMEIIARYDDGGIPPERTAPRQVVTNGNYGGTVIQPNISMTDRILLQSTCSAVPGDLITYIATCDFNNMCNGANNTVSGYVKFRYNASVFNFKGMSPAPLTGVTYNAPIPDPDTNRPGINMVYCTLTNVPADKQYHLFFQLETYDNQALLGQDPKPSAELFIPGSGSCEKYAKEDKITGQTVRNAHDPNYIEVLSNDACDPDGTIQWRIHFQNEGNAPEDSIWISVWIDPMLDFNTLSMSTPKGTINTPWKRPNEHTYNCLVSGFQLKGLAQRGVREDETRSYVDLQTTKMPYTSCNAYVNRARIRFGFKPPIETADAIVPIPCDTCVNPCVTVLDTFLPAHQTAIGDPVISSTLSGSPLLNALQGATSWKWYPSDGLSNPFILNPTLTKDVRRAYTLVASFDTCDRRIIRVPVGPDCTMGIAQNIKLSGNTTCNKPNWDLEATATNTLPTNLMWYNGQTGIGSVQQNGQAPGLVYVGVWDTLTGCSVEKWIRLEEQCQITKPHPWLLIGVSALCAIIGFLLYYIFTKK